jgi:hypothetical protein
MEETHPDEPCTYKLEIHGRVMDGRCLTAAAFREVREQGA